MGELTESLLGEREAVAAKLLAPVVRADRLERLVGPEVLCEMQASALQVVK